MKHFLLIVINILTLTIIVRAQVPQLITHQGYLADTSGQALNGIYPMAFRFFADSTGGSELLGQTFSGVQVTNGAYAVVLDVSILSVNKQLWLETEVFFETLAPRTRLTSVPYALTALSVLGPNSEATGIGASAGGTNNRARGNYSVVSGGGSNSLSDSNAALGTYSSIGGGFHNLALGSRSTISGGYGNIASDSFSTVSGGNNNWAHYFSAVGGGDDNLAIGKYATIPGGAENWVSGNYSFAAGWKAKASHSGAFVWADSAGASGTTFASTAPNQFLIRASGGVGINTATPENTLHIHKNSAGAVTATTNAPLVVENGSSCFLHILSPAANEQGVLFGDPSNSISGGVVMNPANQMEFRAGGNSIRMTVDSDGDVGIGTTTPDGALDITSTTGALIVPRMTTTQRDAITAAAGMIIFNKTTGQFNFYEGGAWITK